MSDTIRCIVRIKPSGNSDPEKSNCHLIKEMNDVVIKHVDKTTLFVEAKFENRNYMCDYVAEENSTQSQIFEEVGVPVLKSFFQGYNCTVFSYGQTGSGKTYTMMGPTNSVFNDTNSDKRGLIPRIVKEIYHEVSILKREKKLSSFSIKCSCFEIYQETILDLVIFQ
jgi:kinesin family protein 15